MDEVALQSDAQGVNWDTLAEIYRRAPLGTPDAEKLRRSYTNSDVCCFAFQRGELIGAGRAISDGESFATICELVVAPEYQRHGIGRAIMNLMLDRLAVPKVILACVHGKEGFYRKLGFHKHKSVMALYENSEWFIENGYLE